MRRPRMMLAAIALVTIGAVTAGCTSAKHDSGAKDRSHGGSGSSSNASQPPSSAMPVAAAELALTPANGAVNVNPAGPIAAKATNGTITTAKLVSSTGTVVPGALGADGSSWTPRTALGYGKSYTMTVAAKNAEGKVVSQASKFTTVQPRTLTMPYLQTIYNQGLKNGGTYGVGMVINVHFDESITNKAAAEKAIHITSNPPTTGAFYWINDQVAHWRPKSYWTPGTTVSVKANLYGVQVGSGLYGEADKAVSFKIGASHIAIADDKTHHVKVYVAGKLVRNMPTSMGRHTSIPGKNGPVSLYTPAGTYTVMDHNEAVVMDSSTFGVPKGDPNYYRETIYWATRISQGGIFLHQLDSTVWAQGSQDLSHGCLNLNHTNATWYFTTSQIGDVVQVINTGGPKLTADDGGDWSVPWATWVKGGAK